MRFAGFIGPSYTLASVPVDCQRTLNWFPEINETGSGKDREVASFQPTPGLSLLATIGAGPIRGLYTATNGVLYAVSYNKLYSVTSAWVATERGTLNTTTGNISMIDNGTTLMLVDGDYGYALTLADNSFLEIADADFPGADQVTYQDGYFIFNVPDSGQFMITEINADLTIDVDALDIATSEGKPDKIVGLISDHRDLWIFNEQSVEVFYNSGNAAFPFERNQGAFIEHGCIAPFSIQKMNNTVFWLGRDDKGAGIVYMAQGLRPQRISTHAVEIAIQGYGDLSNTTAWTYEQNGHFFYVLNFESTSVNTTWVFDTSTNLWHERTYNNEGTQQRHRAQNHAYAYSTHVVGDYQNGKIYNLDSTVYSDAAIETRRVRRSPHISEDMKLIFHHSLEIDMETGVGIDGVGQGIDPQVMMRFSDDGGRTWSNERRKSAGAIGKTRVRVKFDRLGASRNRVYEISISDPVKAVLIGAELTLVKGAS
jgi:hypothetical protein